MRPLLLALSFLLSFSCAQAQEYHNFEPQKLIQQKDSLSGKTISMDQNYLQLTLRELAVHAMHYPPKFDTPRDRDRVIEDLKILSGLFDKLLANPEVNQDLLLSASYVNIMAYKLELPDSNIKTPAIFQRLLAIAPNHPLANLEYGDFLRHSGKPKEAVPFLEKALAGGLTQANRTLGMAWLQLGDPARALSYLEIEQKNNPNALDIRTLIEHIRAGKFKFDKSP